MNKKILFRAISILNKITGKRPGTRIKYGKETNTEFAHIRWIFPSRVNFIVVIVLGFRYQVEDTGIKLTTPHSVTEKYLFGSNNV